MVFGYIDKSWVFSHKQQIELKAGSMKHVQTSLNKILGL